MLNMTIDRLTAGYGQSVLFDSKNIGTYKVYQKNATLLLLNSFFYTNKNETSPTRFVQTKFQLTEPEYIVYIPVLVNPETEFKILVSVLRFLTSH